MALRLLMLVLVEQVMISLCVMLLIHMTDCLLQQQVINDGIMVLHLSIHVTILLLMLFVLVLQHKTKHTLVFLTMELLQ